MQYLPSVLYYYTILHNEPYYVLTTDTLLIEILKYKDHLKSDELLEIKMLISTRGTCTQQGISAAAMGYIVGLSITDKNYDLLNV